MNNNNRQPEHNEKIESVMRRQTYWQNLWFYQKTVVLYQLTMVFTKRFLPKHGDRTVDQMIQAARSGKQNIIEGSADGVTSMEMELKLLNVARSSIQELQEDYEDYIKSRHLQRWDEHHPRYNDMLEYCRAHNNLSDYEKFFDRWTDEEAANIAVTLCKMVDKMMLSYQQKKNDEFVTEGGIRERMTAARLGYRTNQRETIASLTKQVEQLKAENTMLRAILSKNNIEI